MSTIAQKNEIIVNCNWLPTKYVVTANLLLNKVPEKKIFYWICVQTQNLWYNTYHLWPCHICLFFFSLMVL